MSLGYLTYPTAVLLDQDKERLRSSPFISEVRPPGPIFDCFKLFAPPR